MILPVAEGLSKGKKINDLRKMDVSCLIPLTFHSMHSSLRTEKNLSLGFLYPEYLLVKVNLEYFISPDLGPSVSSMEKLVRVF